MKGLTIFFGLAAAGGVSWGVYEYLKRKDDIKKLKAAMAMSTDATAPESDDDVYRPGGDAEVMGCSSCVGLVRL